MARQFELFAVKKSGNSQQRISSAGKIMTLLYSVSEVEAKLATSIQQNIESAFWGEQKLGKVMAYTLLSGGKRLRPSLVLEAARLCAPQLDPTESEHLACPAMLAIEYAHSYSLIHDDLPAMDNDDYRRGQPSCHKAFGEAAAILAGDALLTDAFEILATAKINPALQCLELARAAGSKGMVAGQMADIASPEDYRPLDIEDWLAIHVRKTGLLISCACVLGALSVGAEPTQIEVMRQFGMSLGLAFQLQDDLLDSSPVAKIFGTTVVQARATKEAHQALTALEYFSGGTEQLAKWAVFSVHRKS